MLADLLRGCYHTLRELLPSTVDECGPFIAGMVWGCLVCWGTVLLVSWQVCAQREAAADVRDDAQADANRWYAEVEGLRQQLAALREGLIERDHFDRAHPSEQDYVTCRLCDETAGGTDAAAIVHALSCVLALPGARSAKVDGR